MMTNGEMSPFVVIIYLVPRRNQMTDDEISSSVVSDHIDTVSTAVPRPQPTRLPRHGYGTRTDDKTRTTDGTRTDDGTHTDATSQSATWQLCVTTDDDDDDDYIVVVILCRREHLHTARQRPRHDVKRRQERQTPINGVMRTQTGERWTTTMKDDDDNEGR